MTNFVGYYGVAKNETEYNEFSKPIEEKSFSHQLCAGWEESATQMVKDKTKTRLVCLRTGIVLGRDGGVVANMMFPFEFGLGGVNYFLISSYLRFKCTNPRFFRFYDANFKGDLAMVSNGCHGYILMICNVLLRLQLMRTWKALLMERVLIQSLIVNLHSLWLKH